MDVTCDRCGTALGSRTQVQSILYCPACGTRIPHAEGVAGAADPVRELGTDPATDQPTDQPEAAADPGTPDWAITLPSLQEQYRDDSRRMYFFRTDPDHSDDPAPCAFRGFRVEVSTGADRAIVRGTPARYAQLLYELGGTFGYQGGAEVWWIDWAELAAAVPYVDTLDPPVKVRVGETPTQARARSFTYDPADSGLRVGH